MSTINQKEYLKKYLGLGKNPNEKRKKKKSKIKAKGLKIVDDDIDVDLNEEIKEDLNADNDDAPQIVSVIDERPPSLRIDDKTHNKLWKPLGEPDDETSGISRNIKFEGTIKLSQKLKSKTKIETHIGKSDKNSLAQKLEIKEEPFSPPRRINRHRSSSPDLSPRKIEYSTDLSPPRKQQKSVSLPHTPTKNSSTSPEKFKKRDYDSSPPRRKKKQSSPDLSPSRKSRHKNHWSPHRKRHEREDYSPSYKYVPVKSEDISPPRKSKNETNNYNSPKEVTINPSTGDIQEKDTSLLPKKKSRWGDKDKSDEKLKKTLDGKTAGLQNAHDLATETHYFKQKENELFENLSADISGVNATTVVREKHKKVDWEEEERKRKKEQENKDKYEKWGKGLKQVEDINEKIKNDLYEMSKPLARYADDEDLEKYLKEQEREGDPMLQYIRQKRHKKALDEGIPIKQQYEGDSAPNRFGIKPGYRWDGVNRSNGYEKKWFEVQNSKKASTEESYKWSTEDM